MKSHNIYIFFYSYSSYLRRVILQVHPNLFQRKWESRNSFRGGPILFPGSKLDLASLDLGLASLDLGLLNRQIFQNLGHQEFIQSHKQTSKYNLNFMRWSNIKELPVVCHETSYLIHFCNFVELKLSKSTIFGV